MSGLGRVALVVGSEEHFNLYWSLLLLMVAVQSCLALLGTGIFQKRHHNVLRITNDLPPRIQFGYISLAVALFINVSFLPEQRILGVANAFLLFLAIIAAFGGLKLASEERFNQILKEAQHVCPSTPGAKCQTRLKFGKRIRLVCVNVLALCVVTGLALFITLSIKPSNFSTGEAPQKPLNALTLKDVPFVGQPDWYGDHIFWLQEEGERSLAHHLIKHYAVGEVQYTATVPTLPFTIVLSVPEGYDLATHSAFRVTGTTSHPVMEQLNPIPSDSAFRKIRISVPECEKQDIVVVLFRLDGKHAKGSNSITDIVRARIEGGEP